MFVGVYRIDTIDIDTDRVPRLLLPRANPHPAGLLQYFTTGQNKQS